MTFEEAHKDHEVREVPNELVRRMVVCFTCGVAYIETKYPLEYVMTPLLKIDYEDPLPPATEPEPFSERATAPTIPVPRIANKPRMIIIDDEPTIARALERLLRPDFDVVTFTDCFMALEAVRTHEFEIALVDIHMPGMDGFELRQTLLELQPLVRVVLMTGGLFADEQEKLEGLDSIEKPFSMEQLEGLFKKWRILGG